LKKKLDKFCGYFDPFFLNFFEILKKEENLLSFAKFWGKKIQFFNTTQLKIKPFLITKPSLKKDK
jgi:hypothetical protein